MTHFLYLCVSLAVSIYFFVFVSYDNTVKATRVSFLKGDQNERVFIVAAYYFYFP